MTECDPLTYEVTVMRNGGAIESINFGGYALLHELLTHILEEVAEKGWLEEWPELPNPRLLRPDPTKESP